MRQAGETLPDEPAGIVEIYALESHARRAAQHLRFTCGRRIRVFERGIKAGGDYAVVYVLVDRGKRRR